jgi:hypothetical protein
MESPMSMNIGGFENKNDMEIVFADMNGKKMNWESVLNYVKHNK